MKVISKERELLKWLAKSIKQKEPRRPMPAALGNCFDTLFLSRCDGRRAFPSELTDRRTLFDVFGALLTWMVMDSDLVETSYAVLWFVVGCHGETVAAAEEMSLLTFARLGTRVLDLPDTDLEPVQENERWYLRSSVEFEQARGFRVRVPLDAKEATTPLPEHLGEGFLWDRSRPEPA